MNSTTDNNNLIEIGGNQPLILDEKNCFWIVEKGCAELFTAKFTNGVMTGNRRHLTTISEGNIICGAGIEKDNGYNYIVTGLSDTFIRKLPLELLNDSDTEFGKKLPQLIKTFVEGVLSRISVKLIPEKIKQLSIEESCYLTEGETCCSVDDFCWLYNEVGAVSLFNYKQKPFEEESVLPFSKKIWVTALEESECYIASTKEIMAEAYMHETISELMSYLLSLDEQLATDEAKAEFARLKKKNQNDARFVSAALGRMKSVITNIVNPDISDLSSDPLFSVIQKLAVFMRMEVKLPSNVTAEQPLTLDMISNSLHIRTRTVILKEKWWKQDSGPLIGYLEDTQQPVALIPRNPTSYWLENPADGTKIRVNEKVAQMVSPIAYSLYKPFLNKPLNIVDLAMYSGKSIWKRDIALVILLGFFGGVFGLVVPMATGLLFDTIIPQAELLLLIQLVCALVIVDLANFLFDIVNSYAQQRLEGRLDYAVQGAVWDKLLRLPVSFFKQYTAGDLANRALSITEIRKTLFESAISTILSGVFTSMNLLLMFWYDWKLGIVGIILIAFAFFVTLLCSAFRFKFTAKEQEFDGEIDGLMLQLFSGIAKFRVSGAENRAFGVWAKIFTNYQQVSFKSSLINSVMTVFESAYPIICSMVIFFMLITLNSGDSEALGMSTGTFLAFNAAFGALLASALLIAQTLVSVVEVVPLYKRVQPILKALPEIDDAKAPPQKLVGGIEVSNLSFRYAPDMPEVIKGVSFDAKPGQFIAIVGPSGCGKSTLLRLLLGFEKPDTGGIYYDGQDISSVDITLLRQQLGVVLQNGRLMAGNIYENIVGSKSLTVKEAMLAAKMAGFDKDIKDMPMGIHTVVNEGGTNLSGGQRQRLLIARAIASNPRIIYFDEATSALDNITQKIVSESLEKMNATRIVIAHRLSTVINADKILVFDKGKIIEQGSYEELMNLDGVFADLARRQIA